MNLSLTVFLALLWTVKCDLDSTHRQSLDTYTIAGYLSYRQEQTNDEVFQDGLGSSLPSNTETNRCKAGSVVINRCGERCECVDGRVTNCYRVRHEFTKMSIKDRSHFIAVYKKASTHHLYKDRFEQLVSYHILVPDDLLHNSSVIFLPWHRWYMAEWENFLRKIDCRVTIPYWDWSRVADTWWSATRLRDVWNPGDHGLGGNGVPPDNCVEDGLFRTEVWNLTRIAGGGCLKREFNYDDWMPDREHIDAYLSYPASHFSEFEKNIREYAHVAFHDAVGGTMGASAAASNAPEILLHHSFLDKIWTAWQRKGEEYKYLYFPDVPFKLPFSSFYGWEWLDNDNLPGGLKVRYEEL